jgi:RNA polymerase sigma-70 factor (ECF subfamily)
MSEGSSDFQSLLENAAGNPTAAGKLFDLHRDRLRRMIDLRMDRRVRGRLDPSDVLQEAFVEFAGAISTYVERPDAPFYVWLRCITGRKLHALHRQHLGTRMRDAGREFTLPSGALPEADSHSLAAQLLGRLTTPSQAFARAEIQTHIQDALTQLTETDREVLALRHFEQLNNQETAFTLGISEAAASVRFIRALRRLKQTLGRVPGLLDEGHTTAGNRASPDLNSEC